MSDEDAVGAELLQLDRDSYRTIFDEGAFFGRKVVARFERELSLLLIGRRLLRCSSPGAQRQNVGASCVGVPFGFQLFGEFWFLGGQVVSFGAVGFQVVEFPGFVLFGDKFPVAVADGTVAFMLPEQRLLAAQ